MHAYVGAVTDRALAWHAGRVATIVAAQHILALVVDEAHIAIDALRHIMTIVALDAQREAATVLEQDGLIVLLQGLFHGIQKSAAEVSLHGLAPTLHTHVAEDDLRHLHTAIAFCDLHQTISPIQGVEVTLIRRCGRAQHNVRLMHGGQHNGGIAGVVTRSWIDLLETAVVFLVNDNQAYIGIWQEDSRPRTNNDLVFWGLRLSEATHLLPHLNSLVGAIPRVINAQPVAKIFF